MGNLFYLFKGENNMSREISVFDVARTFLTYEEMTHKKLQKLCYYAQAWHLALYKSRLFNSSFEAWVHGPVCRELYNEYKPYGWNDIPSTSVVPKNIDENELEFLDIVFNTYGGFDGDQLEALTHSELPWQEARKGLEEWEPSSEIINEKTVKDFYWKAYEQSQND